MHMRRAPAFTYAMRIEGAATPCCKIGWSFDWGMRERQFNQAAMPEVGGLRYRTILHELWDTAAEAFRMEQALLRKFDARRHPQNREILASTDVLTIQGAWIDYIMEARRRNR
ncbi:hypothetical protein OFEAOIEE_LOCUS348 [Methylorubrum extorquens]